MILTRALLSIFSRESPAVLILLAFVLLGTVAALGERSGFPYLLVWKRLTRAALPGAVAWNDSLGYVGGADGSLLALESETGLRGWNSRGLAPLLQVPVRIGGLIVVADDWGGVRAFREGDGVPQWQDMRVARGDAVLVVDSLLYSGSADGWVYARRWQDGTELWRLRTGLRRAIASAISGGHLYTSTSDGDLLLVDVTDGRRVCRFSLGTVPLAGRLIWQDRVFAADAAGIVWALRANDLRPLWSVRLGTVPRKFLVADQRLFGCWPTRVGSRS